MNINEILEELKHCNLSEYDIRSLATYQIRNIVYQKTGYYLNERDIDINQNISMSVNAMIKRLITAYDSIDNANICYHLSGYRYAIREINDNGTMELYHSFHISNDIILFIVRYAINGTFDKDYAIIHKMQEENNIKYDDRKYYLKVNPAVSIESFKNGKVIVKGLSAEHITRIRNAYEITKKYLNVKI